MHRCAVLTCLLLLRSLARAEFAPPDVTYVESQDRACAAERRYEIREEWVKELNQILPEFRALWNAKGKVMFSAVVSLTHRPIEPVLVPVRLTLCDNHQNHSRVPA